MADHPPPPPDATEPDPDEAERLALGRIVHALREYKVDAEWEVTRWEYNYSRLSEAHKALVPNLPAKIAAAHQCIYQNHLFIKSMLSSLDDAADSSQPPSLLAGANQAAEDWAARVNNRVSPHDVDKARYVFKNLMRDWSAEGEEERQQSYGRILLELQRLFPNNNDSNTTRTVLVPGTGLGRLCAEIAGLGFESLGNEFSYYMLLTSAFILNGTSRAEQWTVHPWILNSNNHLSDSDQLRPVQIPDIEPYKIVNGGSMGMCAGDFAQVFRHDDYDGYFDAVTTCFFIDTANNIIEYLEVIYKCLKPGGYWINLGPLLWHWADSHSYLGDGGEQGELSIELSLKDVQRVAQQMGFRFENMEMVTCGYMSNKKSMLKQEYDCAFWTAQKTGPVVD